MASAQKPRPTNHFRLNIGGREAIGQFREVSGLDSEQEIVEQKEVDAKRGIDVDKSLWEWRHQVETEGPDAARVDCLLELIDYDGSTIAGYKLLAAWPSKYTGAAMNAGSNEVAVEAMTICHEGFERV